MRWMLTRHLLLAPAGEGGDLGGGGDPAITQDVTALINSTVNSAVTSQLKRLLGPAVTEALGGLKIGELVANAVKEAVPKPAEPNPPPAGESKPDPRFIALEDQVKTLKAENAREKEAREAAETKSWNDNARSAVAAALSPHVRPEGLKIATNTLLSQIDKDEQGTPLLKVRRSPSAGMPEEDMHMTIADGIQHWLKQDEAKLFIPAPAPREDQSRRSPSPRAVKAGANGLPQYEGEAVTDGEKFRRADEKTAALTARLRSEGHST